MPLPPAGHRLAVLAACACAVSVLARAPADAATVSTLDGRVLSGPTLSFDAKALTVLVGGTAVGLGDCDWIEPGDGAGMPAPAGKQIGVWLSDGSWLPATALGAAAGDDAVQVAGVLGALTLPLASLRGWSTGAELPGPREGADTDVVQLDSGVVTGRVDGLRAGKLVLRSDLDPSKPLELAIEQIRALRLSVPTRPAKGMRLSVSLSEAHAALRVVVAASGAPEQALCLAAAPQIAVGKALLPSRLRLEGGRRVYLSETTPDQVVEEGAFGVVWPWSRDRNLDGSPLKLGGVRYDRGIVVHSKALLAWNLNGAYTRLRALIGIADIVADQGDCAASLIADGKELWHRDSVKGGDKPIPLDLDLTGVRRLELHVDYGARYDIGDHLALADSYLVKALAR
jgi:hypothetical protein